MNAHRNGLFVVWQMRSVCGKSLSAHLGNSLLNETSTHGDIAVIGTVPVACGVLHIY